MEAIACFPGPGFAGQRNLEALAYLTLGALVSPSVVVGLG